MKALTIVSLSLWLGTMGFFALIVAPTAFGVLEREAAGRLLTALMPRYHWAGLALGLIALAGVLGRAGQRRQTLADRLPLILLLLMVGLTLHSLLVMLPQVESLWPAARAARGSPEALRFARLHRLSTLANLAVMVAGAAALAIEAIRRPVGPGAG